MVVKHIHKSYALTEEKQAAKEAMLLKLNYLLEETKTALN